MSFIVTAGGDEIDLRNPRPAHITIASIAHSLAQINRFNGHAARPYSVAEHSLLVCQIVDEELHLDVHAQLAALLHDAHEAFCGDMTTPLKAEIGPAWHEFEHRWERCVRGAFAVLTPSHVHAAAIKRADLIAMATEKRDLLPGTPSPWPVLHGVEPLTLSLWSRERRAMTWEDWRARFLDKYEELEYERDLRVMAVGAAS